MSDTKHTPEKWVMKDFTEKPDSSCDNGFMIFLGKGNVPIAKVYRGSELSHDHKKQEERARLIAAAPALLEALLAEEAWLDETDLEKSQELRVEASRLRKAALATARA